MDNRSPFNQDTQAQVSNPLHFNSEVVQIADPLSLDIEDDELSRIVKQRVDASEKFFKEKYNLKVRRRVNEDSLFGRQVANKEKDNKYKDYETRSSDNAIYEIETSLKPLAMSKLPDLIVTPGGDDKEREESAKNLSLAVDNMGKKREQRMVLGLGFKHLPVYFTAVVKTRWNSEIGSDGDYEFLNINPEYIVVDHTCNTKNPDDMSFIAQCTPMTVQDLLMKFPKKKELILETAKVQSYFAGKNPEYKELATEVKPLEVWFDWYKRKGKDELLTKDEMMSIDEPGVKWERVSGVLWMLEDKILDKMLDPNFDHEGEEKQYIYDVPGDETTKHEVNPEEMLIASLTGQPMPEVVTEKVYHNYFTRPHKPFYFFGYDQWGKTYLDETSRIEQNVRNQENLDDQNKTILDQLKTRIKHIWSKESGMDKAAIQKLDLDDPKMDVIVEGKPGEVHAEVRPERPDSAQFKGLNDTRQRMYAISHSTAVRGQLQSDVATTNQIGREADFTVTDDLVEDTINACSEWMAEWGMHFIKLRYTEDHMVQIMGAKGQMTYVRLRRDMISDGMEVMIKASSTDKLKAQRNAMETAKLGPPFTDPINFFQDMGMNDPEGRTEKGMMFMSDPMGYFTKYVLHLDDTEAKAKAITQGLETADTPVYSGTPKPETAPNPSVAQPSMQDTSQIPTQQPPMPQGSPRAL